MVKYNPVDPSSDRSVRLITIGHGTISADELVHLLEDAGVQIVVDVRSAPGSRRHPQFGLHELECSLPAKGIDYRWEPDLGGFRRLLPGSPNIGLRHPSFRGYADYMASGSFERALTRLLDEARSKVTAIMCAETVWWRCHRRLVADAAELVYGAEVWHLDHRGQLLPHRLTDGVSLESGHLIYLGSAAGREAGTRPQDRCVN